MPGRPPKTVIRTPHWNPLRQESINMDWAAVQSVASTGLFSGGLEYVP
jgi:hypothetical protein